MTLEGQYPELKDMKDSEMFIEWAYIVKTSGVTKLPIKRIFPKKERNAFVKVLELVHDVKKYIDDPSKDENVELVTITR
jgi:hypothetical protein